MAKKVFTIFFEDEAIKILTTRGERVEKWANIPLDAGMIKDGVVADEEKMASLLRERLKDLKISEKRVIIGLSTPNASYRLLDQGKALFAPLQ